MLLPNQKFRLAHRFCPLSTIINLNFRVISGCMLKISLLLIFLFPVQEEPITSDVEFLVIASDGLWDVVSNQVYFKIFNRFATICVLYGMIG